MALTPVEMVRFIIADTPDSKFYPLIKEDKGIEAVLNIYGGNIPKAAAYCAGIAYRELVKFATKEKYGDMEVWAEDKRYYLDSLQALQNDPSAILPANFMPYIAGISQSDLDTSADDLDNPRRKSFLYTNTTECEQYGFNFTTPV
jgi:hypothetical protein